MKLKNRWENLRIWQKALIVGIIPINLVFLIFFPHDCYASIQLMWGWVMFFLIPPIFFTLIWLFIYWIASRMKNKQGAKALIIIAAALYLGILIFFSQIIGFFCLTDL